MADLSAPELGAFGEELSALEKPLRERLELATACGVPRGNDRYWEFSLDPVHDLGLAWELAELLSSAGLLPRDRRQALHATLGGLRLDADCYYLAMALEALHVEPARLLSGAAAARAAIFTGWGRKGSAGLFQKGAQDLKAGASSAVEIRTLQLPTGAMEWESMARLLRRGADAVAQRQEKIDSPEARWFGALRESCEGALESRGLPMGNWWRGGADGGVRHDAWEGFAAALPALRADIEPAVLARSAPQPRPPLRPA